MLFVGTQCATEGMRSLKPRGRIMHTGKLFSVAQKSTDLVHPAFYWGLLYQPVNLFPPRGRLAGRDCTRTATSNLSSYPVRSFRTVEEAR